MKMIASLDGKILDSDFTLRDLVDPSDFQKILNLADGDSSDFQVQGILKSQAVVIKDFAVKTLHGVRCIEFSLQPSIALPEHFDSKRDYHVYCWLSKLREPQKIQCWWHGLWLNVRCADRVSVQEAHNASEDLLSSGAIQGFSIFRGRESKPWVSQISLPFGKLDNEGANLQSNGANQMLTNTSTEVGTSSSWANTVANRNVLQVIPGGVTIHSARPETGYAFLAVKSDISEKRLNKPIAELLNQPLSTIDPLIAEPRRHYMEQAIASGGTQSYSYDYQWEGLLWRFNVEIAYLPGHDEVMTIASDAQSWQREYWLARV